MEQTCMSRERSPPEKQCTLPGLREGQEEAGDLPAGCPIPSYNSRFLTEGITRLEDNFRYGRVR